MNLLDGVSALVLAGYLGAVVINGNLSSLLTLLKGEFGYLELLIGLFVFRELMKLPETSSISKAFVAVGVTAGMLKLVMAVNPQTFSNFASGKTDLISFVTSLAQQAGSTVNPRPAQPNQPVSI